MTVGTTYTLQIDWRNDDNGLTAQNSLYFRQEEGLVFDTVGEDLSARYNDECAQLLADVVWNRYGISGYKVLETLTGEVLYEGVASGITPAASGELLPVRLAAILSYKSGPGKKRQGRNFLPPTSEANNTAGGVAAAYQTSINNYIAAIQGMAGSNILYSRYTWMQYSPTLAAVFPVTSAVIRPYWGGQRNRNR